MNTINQNLKPSARCIALASAFEGCKLTAYQDSVGVWTIAHGRIYNDDGTRVAQGDTCTQAQADQWLLDDLESEGAHYVRTWCQGDLTQDEFDALTDFTYNTGAGTLRHSSILEALNLGSASPQDIAELFLPYDHAGNMELAGLERRRKAEAALFVGDYATMQALMNS